MRDISGINAIIHAHRFSERKPSLLKHYPKTGLGANLSGLLIVQEYDVNAPVLATAFLGIIAGNRKVLAHTDGSNPGRINAKLDQCGQDCISTLL